LAISVANPCPAGCGDRDGRLQEKNSLENGIVAKSQALGAKLGKATGQWTTQARSGGSRLLAQARRLAEQRSVKLGLRTYLIMFGLAIVVPVLLFSAIILHRYTLSERASNERRALAIARALSADVDREITAIITTLEALATSPALATKDFMAFHVQALEALRSRPSWNVVLIDATRQQQVNTRLPLGARLPVSEAEPPVTDIVRQTGQPYITDLFRGTVARRLIFAVGVPVHVGDGIPYALIMSLDPERLAELLRTPELPDGWLAAVADRKNVNMARSHQSDRFIGQPVPGEWLRQYGNRAEGVVTTTDFEGQRSLQAFHWSKVTGWWIAAWAPLSEVEAPLRQAWNTFLFAGATLLGLSLLLALGIGGRMAGPIADLMRAGRRLGHGKPVQPLSTALREADELSLVLANAAKELRARTEAQGRLATIVSSSPNAMVSQSPDGIIRTWNAAAERLFGYQASEVTGRSARMFYTGEQQSEFADIIAEVRSGTAVHRDVQRRHKDGHLIDVSISVAPMYDDAGRVVGISSIVSDIGERKAREKQIEFLMRELSHRSKNLLAVVQAIAGQTARYSDDLEEFQTRFSQRLHAMARAQDLLVARNWEGAQLTELVRSQLAPFTEDVSTRIEMSGPELDLRPDAVHNLTLALHELATNAAKYGALSVPDGRVAVDWEVAGGEPDDLRFRMSWREHSGPPVRPPDRKGFGHVVIADMVGSALRGHVQLLFESSGVRWKLDVPAASVIKKAEGGPAQLAQPRKDDG
jgi:PAS domain S-box-containing protein